MGWVMFTGDDSVFLTWGNVRVAVENFLNDLAARWHSMQVAIDDEGSFRQWKPRVMRLPEGSFTVLIARDEHMVAEWDNSRYVLDEFEEGPIFIYCDPAAHKLLRVHILPL